MNKIPRSQDKNVDEDTTKPSESEPSESKEEIDVFFGSIHNHDFDEVSSIPDEQMARSEAILLFLILFHGRPCLDIHELSEGEVPEGCRQAHALGMAFSLSEGLNTYCDSRGLHFSGGQRQRIAVARALMSKPRISLLDKATCALHTQSERIVQEALNKAASRRTVVVIAHRPSTIRHAHVIFVMDGGKAVEEALTGSCKQLNGCYQAIYVARSLEYLRP